VEHPNAEAQSLNPYLDRLHQLQKDLMVRYFSDLTRIADSNQTPAVYLLISGHPVELIRAFGLMPVFPEINALQSAVKHQSLPLIQKAEEIGYSTDNCAYVKADIGLWYAGGVTPLAKIPKPALLLTNYVGCNVYLHWWEHLKHLSGAPLVDLDVPFLRSQDGEPRTDDVLYVRRQLQALIPVLEHISGVRYDPDRLRAVLDYSRKTEDLWVQIKQLAQARPAPFDAYFDAATMMGPLHVFRGTPEGLDYFRQAFSLLKRAQEQGQGVQNPERFRLVIEGPPPWPHFRAFREMFSRWGAVFVASSYSTVGGLWDWGFRHDPDDPLTTIAYHMLKWNLAIRPLVRRYEQLARYLAEFKAEGLVIHSVKSCRLFSAGQGDMREYFAREHKVPTLLVESDLEDPRYFSPAQMRTRIDAFMESLTQHQHAQAKLPSSS
jgi:benzoyl-CoA reductase subunit B